MMSNGQSHEFFIALPLTHTAYFIEKFLKRNYRDDSQLQVSIEGHLSLRCEPPIIAPSGQIIFCIKDRKWGDLGQIIIQKSSDYSSSISAIDPAAEPGVANGIDAVIIWKEYLAGLRNQTQIAYWVTSRKPIFGEPDEITYIKLENCISCHNKLSRIFFSAHAFLDKHKNSKKDESKILDFCKRSGFNIDGKRPIPEPEEHLPTFEELGETNPVHIEILNMARKGCSSKMIAEKFKYSVKYIDNLISQFRKKHGKLGQKLLPRRKRGSNEELNAKS